MREHAVSEPLSFLGRPLPRGYDPRAVVVPPGCSRRYDATEWQDTIAVVEWGEIELESGNGERCRFAAGAVLSLGGLALRALHNPGGETAVLVAVSRRATHAARDTTELT